MLYLYILSAYVYTVSFCLFIPFVHYLYVHFLKTERKKEEDDAASSQSLLGKSDLSLVDEWCVLNFSMNKMIYIFLSTLLCSTLLWFFIFFSFFFLIDVSVCFAETKEIFHTVLVWIVEKKKQHHIHACHPSYTQIHFSTDIRMQFIKPSDRWQIFGTLPCRQFSCACVGFWMFYYVLFVFFSSSGVSLKNGFELGIEKQIATKIWQFQWRVSLCLCLRLAIMLKHLQSKSLTINEKYPSRFECNCKQ